MPKNTNQPLKLRKEMFLIALEKHKGVGIKACKELKMSYDTYTKWFKEDEQFRKQCLTVDKISIEYVEGKLYDLIDEGNVTAIIFYLKCRRHDKWNDKSNQIDLNVTSTQFQISSGQEIQLIDLNENKLLENE